MTPSLKALKELIVLQNEDEHLEFKEAKTDFPFEKLVKYCAALSNEGGGKLVLGVTDKRPRMIVGTEAFKDLSDYKFRLFQKLDLRIEMHEVMYPEGRVLVITIPGRPLGHPIQHDGAYWMRAGENLVPMTNDMLKRIFSETDPEFSGEICKVATMDDLDPLAIEYFRNTWIKKSKNPLLAQLSVPQLLKDAGFVTDHGITNAAVILLGFHKSVRRIYPQVEFVFEYRMDEQPGPAHQRIEYTQGFFLFFDSLWDTINLRNDKQHFQDGFLMLDVPTFNEKVIREAILNAVAHRDYTSNESIFLRQFPRKIEIQNPGGLPKGITPQNILWKHNARNRLIAEIFLKCGLVEKAGQGANLMFKETICEGKPLPEFTHSDDYGVFLTFPSQIRDPNFLRFLEKIGREKVEKFSIEDLLILDLVQQEETIPRKWRRNLRKLVDAGVLEKFSAEEGIRYVFSRRYYSFIGAKGTYTLKRGLDQETHKELLMKHIRDNANEGSKFHELMQVLPMLRRDQIKYILKELKQEEKVYSTGESRWALWYPTVLPKLNPEDP